MKKFKFEIQNCINVEIESDCKENARREIIDNLKDYAEQMVDSSCYVSEGVEE